MMLNWQVIVAVAVAAALGAYGTVHYRDASIANADKIASLNEDYSACVIALRTAEKGTDDAIKAETESRERGAAARDAASRDADELRRALADVRAPRRSAASSAPVRVPARTTEPPDSGRAASVAQPDLSRVDALSAEIADGVREREVIVELLTRTDAHLRELKAAASVYISEIETFNIQQAMPR